jgi:hypothetical protein
MQTPFPRHFSMHRTTRLVASILVISFLSGCAYPRVVDYYDEECQIMARKMVVDATKLNVLDSCQHDQCLMDLVLGATVAATSAVVSGSIVYVGNVIYWKERNKKCRKDQPLLPPMPASMSPS